MRPWRDARALPAVAALALLFLFTMRRDSWAHGAVQSSFPAAGAHLDVVPRVIRLNFTMPAERAFTTIQLLGPDGRRLPLSATVVSADSPRVATASINAAIGPGVYTVEWQFGGRDGHPVRGRFNFTVAPGARVDARVLPSGRSREIDTVRPHHSPSSIPESPVPGAFDAGSRGYAAIRWLTFIAAFGLLGAATFRYVVLRRVSTRGAPYGVAIVEPSLHRAAALGVLAAVLLVAAAIARLIAQSVAMHGSERALDVDGIRDMLAFTLWGRAWLLQTISALLALLGFLAVRRGRFKAWGVVAAAAGILAVSLSLSGHAPASESWAAAAVTADTLHVIGAAGWLGSLLFVLLAGIPAAMRLPPDQRGAAVAEVVNAFSPTALVFAGLAAVTGVFGAAVHLQSVDALWSSSYGRTLLLKLAVLSAVTATGAYNWLRVRPVLGDESGTRRIKRSATIELIVATVVLGITAVLVAISTPAMW